MDTDVSQLLSYGIIPAAFHAWEIALSGLVG